MLGEESRIRDARKQWVQVAMAVLPQTQQRCAGTGSPAKQEFKDWNTDRDTVTMTGTREPEHTRGYKTAGRKPVALISDCRQRGYSRAAD